MTVTVNSDCSQITFTSTNFIIGMNSLELRTKYNSAQTPTVFNLNYKISGIVSNSFTLSPTNYYYPSGLPSGTTAPTKFCDGIYYFEVYSTDTTNDVVPLILTATESSCTFVDCETKCKMAEKFPYNNKEDMYLIDMYYNAIKYATDCDSCNCSSAYDLYTDLRNMLNMTTTINHDTGCGC
jgi:hypothetical protein